MNYSAVERRKKVRKPKVISLADAALSASWERLNKEKWKKEDKRKENDGKTVRIL